MSILRQVTTGTHVRMWFLAVPDRAPNSDGEWSSVTVNTKRPSEFKTVWDYYNRIVRSKKGEGFFCAASSRVNPELFDKA